MRRLPLLGKKFGRLTVTGTAPRTYQTMWECICECGKVCVVAGQRLTEGHTRSCGCLREELRPTYARRRDFTGLKNPRAAKSKARAGDAYVPSNSVWYKRAAGIFYQARKNGVPLGFSSVSSLAAYVISIRPKKCPVFGRTFVDRGSGFSRWSPSIDKIDPRKGYVEGNIQVISMLANCMKRDASLAELRQFAAWVQRELL